MRLRHSDLTRLLNAITDLHSDTDPVTLSERALRAASTLVAGEITAFDFFNSSGVHSGEYWYDPPNAISPSEYEIFSNVVHEHPFFPEVFGRKRREAITISDCLNTSKFHGTGIYNEYYRLYGVDHQLCVAIGLPTNDLVTYTHSRVKSDFSAEERLIIDFFAPHLRNAISNGRFIERLQSAANQLNSALSGRSLGIVSFSGNVKERFLSEHGQTLLDRYYGREELTFDGIPKRLTEWIANCDAQRQADPMMAEFKLKLVKGDGTLGLTVLFNDANQETTVFLEEQRKATSKTLQRLGLTPRQAEILFWVSQGKTDKDIAALLAISHRTVQKHLESIYQRIGVETRTAAMSVAIEQS